MSSFKVGRMSEDIKRELTDILRDIKDPRVDRMLTVVRVDLSNDLTHCMVYVSCFEGIEKAEKSVEGLTSAAGFIKRELFHRLHMRKCPDLKFIADDSIAHSAEINQKLKEL